MFNEPHNTSALITLSVGERLVPLCPTATIALDRARAKLCCADVRLSTSIDVNVASFLEGILAPVDSNMINVVRCTVIISPV